MEMTNVDIPPVPMDTISRGRSAQKLQNDVAKADANIKTPTVPIHKEKGQIHVCQSVIQRVRHQCVCSDMLTLLSTYIGSRPGSHF